MHTLARRVAVTVVAATLGLSAIAGPATAHALKGAPKAQRIEHAKAHKTAAQERVAAAKATRAAKVRALKVARAKAAKAAEAKARKAARFVATGVVTAVDAPAGTLSVLVDGGTKSLRGAEVTVTVPSDVAVNRDDVAATLGDVLVGDHVAVRGARSGETLTANRVNATSPEPEEAIEDPTVGDPTQDLITDPTQDPITEGDPVIDGGDQTAGDPSGADTP